MRNQKLIIIISILLMSISYPVHAQERGKPQRMMMPEGSFTWLTDNHSAEIPFNLIANHIVIPVLINNQKEVQLIIDTGMPMGGALLLSDKDIDDMGLSIMGKMPIKGAGGGTSMAKLAQGVEFKIGNLKFTNQMLIIMHEDPSRSSHLKDDGVIGSELFKRFVVQIDYEKSTITLVEPENYEPDTTAEEISINLDSGYPIINCSATLMNGETVPLNMVMDLGASHALALNLDSQKGIILPDNYINTVVGHGATGEVFGNLGRIKNFKIGSYTFENVLATFNEKRLMPFEREGNLGNGIMKRFNLTIDYSNKRIFIKPNKSYNDPFEFNMSGLRTSKTGIGFLQIDTIIPDSPASEKDLRTGDLIIEINGKPTKEISRENMKKIFSEEGEIVRLKVLRDQKKFSVSIKLRPLI